LDVQVWTESRSIASIVQRDCRELAVSLYASAGFASVTLPYEAAGIINEDARDKPVVVLYIGDFDPAGVLIDGRIEIELQRHLDRDITMQFERIAINEDQIATYDLPTKPRKETDRRAQHVQCSVEAEAMPAGILRQLLRDRIEQLLPDGALVDAERIDEQERKRLAQAAFDLREAA
jgi:hypothetical protein